MGNIASTQVNQGHTAKTLKERKQNKTQTGKIVFSEWVIHPQSVCGLCLWEQNRDIHYSLCSSLWQPPLGLPPRGPGPTTGSLHPQQFLTHTGAPNHWRSLRNGGWRLPCSGPLYGPREPRREDRGGYVAGCSGTGAGQPAQAAGWAPPEGRQEKDDDPGSVQSSLPESTPLPPTWERTVATNRKTLLSDAVSGPSGVS